MAIRMNGSQNAIAGLTRGSQRPKRSELPGMSVQQRQKACARAVWRLADASIGFSNLKLVGTRRCQAKERSASRLEFRMSSQQPGCARKPATAAPNGRRIRVQHEKLPRAGPGPAAGRPCAGVLSKGAAACRNFAKCPGSENERPFATPALGRPWCHGSRRGGAVCEKEGRARTESSRPKGRLQSIRKRGGRTRLRTGSRAGKRACPALLTRMVSDSQDRRGSIGRRESGDRLSNYPAPIQCRLSFVNRTKAQRPGCLPVVAEAVEACIDTRCVHL